MKVLLLALCVIGAFAAEDLVGETPFVTEIPGQDLDAFAKQHFNKTWAALFPEPNDFVYQYDQSSGRFQGPAYSGGNINVIGCSGRRGSCRNNPNCQCQVSVGPLPRATYRIGSEQTFKGMQSCYALSPISGNMCGRSGFLIHGGSCGADPSEGCIIIENPATRHLIKGGGTLHVVA